jgi:hypothetical protein
VPRIREHPEFPAVAFDVDARQLNLIVAAGTCHSHQILRIFAPPLRRLLKRSATCLNFVETGRDRRLLGKFTQVVDTLEIQGLEPRRKDLAEKLHNSVNIACCVVASSCLQVEVRADRIQFVVRRLANSPAAECHRAKAALTDWFDP